MSITIDGSGTITGATTMASTIASPTLTTPALGIPSSGTVTNLTGTASININGTVGATTPAAGAFTTLSASGGIVSTLASLGANTGNVVLLKSDGTLTTDGTQLNWDSANDALTINSGIVISSSQLRTSGATALTLSNADGSAYVLLNPGGGNVGIGTASPSYQLHVNTDSAGKPGTGGLWTVVSDERIKANIVPANLDRCYEIVKSVPLKHFGFAPGVYTDDQIHDKHNLGWIAQDVQKVFKHAVSVKPFTLKTAIPDGTEDYEEQAFTLETVEETKVSIQVINGKPVQVSKTVSTENKVLLFDTVEVTDEAGAVVMESYEVSPAVDAVLATDETEATEAVSAVIGTRPVTYQMPRMVKKSKPKVRHEVIEDCLDLNSGQMIAALYGAVQALMAKVDTLEVKLAAR